MINIVDLFNNKSKEFISSQRWLVENKNLTNFETRKFSIALLASEMESEYLNMEHHIVNAIKTEINLDLNKLIHEKLFTSNKFDYLDLRLLCPIPDYLTNLSICNIERLVILILSNDYKNLVTSGLISSYLQDSSRFVPYMKTADFKTFINFDSFGRLDHVELYNYHHMRYNDGRICLFNGVEFNIGKMKAYEKYNSSMAPRIIIEYEVDYNIGDSKLIFVIDNNENTEAFKQYTSLNRDIKIDNILD